MMQFEIAKAAMVQLLGDAAEGRFRVIGFQRQSTAESEIVKNDRLVNVYFSEGAFPKQGGMRGPKIHDITLEIDMKASAKAQVDLTVLESTTATAQQKAAALAALVEASDLADNYTDELVRIVYQIIMDARNEGLGLPKGDISSRWIDSIKKDTTIERGDLVVKTANMKYTCRVQEQVPGAIGAEPDPVIFNTSIKAGDTEGAGVYVENENE